MLRLRRPAIIIVCVGVVILGGFAWLAVAKVIAANSLQSYEHQSAPEFLFEQRPFQFRCADRPQPLPPGDHAIFSSSGLAPFARTRVETLRLPLTQVPALTITSEPMGFIHIAGADQDTWDLQLCAIGEGDSEQEARQSLQQVWMTRTGSLISLSATQPGRTGGHGDLFATVPEAAPLTLNVIGAVELRNMSGPVRVSAVGGRATFLNTTGTVDANAGIVDFAGARGRVMLNSFSEIDIKLTGPRFLGSLSAYGQREVRVLVPRGFQSPIEVMVSQKKDLVCKADFCSGMKPMRDAGSYRFIKYAGDGEAAADRVFLRSDHSTVVIDNWRLDPIHPLYR